MQTHPLERLESQHLRDKNPRMLEVGEAFVGMNHGWSTGLSCPQCGWNDVRVSYHARFLDYALAFLILTPLRCRKCRLRFYRPWFMVRRAASSGVPEVETRSALPAISS